MSLNKISERVYYLNFEDKTDRPVLGYIRGDKFSLAIDAGNSKNHVDQFYQSIKDMGLRQPDFTVLTHYHWDHTFGMHAISGKSIACTQTNQKLNEMTQWGWSDKEMKNRLELGLDTAFCDEHIKIEYDNLSDIKVITSDIIFENQLTIDLGGVHCVLMQVTAPHTKDSVLVYIPEEKTLFIGDADCGDSYNDGKCEQSKLMAFIHTIKTIDFDTYIIGHDKPETKETAMIYLQDELKKEVR